MEHPRAADDRAEAEALARLFRALGDPTRVRVLTLLTAGERPAGELVRALGQPQPQVSNHLAALRTAGLVRTRREHRRIHYALADPRLASVLAEARTLLQEPAVDAEAAVEAAAGPAASPAPAPPPPAEPPMAPAPRDLVVFVLGGEEYALPIAAVREIVRFAAPRLLPGSAPDVRGVVQVHGALLEVVDVRSRLGLPAAAPESELVVVEHAGGATAMPVEGVVDVLHVAPGDLRPPPAAAAHLEGVATVGERLVLVLRPSTAALVAR